MRPLVLKPQFCSDLTPRSISYTPYAVPAQQFGVHKVSILGDDGLADVANLCAYPPLILSLIFRIKHFRSRRYIGMRWGSAPDGRKDHDLQCANPLPQRHIVTF